MEVNDYITLTVAAKFTPGRPSTSTLWRWAVKGFRLRDGSVLVLQHLRVGGRVLTTKAWVDEFVFKTAAAQPKPPPLPPTRTVRQVSPARRAKQIAEAMERLRSRHP